MRFTSFLGFLFLAFSLLFPTLVLAEEETDLPFLDIRFMGTDLIDEFAYSWKKHLPLPKNSRITIAEISAPVGLDERFNDMIENRLYELFVTHKQIPIDLVHCSVCSQWVTKSTAKGTILSKGINQPEVLKQIMGKTPDLLALSLNFEAEGRELVLRAIVFEPQNSQKIVWAKRYTTSRSSRRLLRKAEPLISLEQAQKDQRMMLEGVDPTQFVTRLSIRNFNSANAQVTPLMFVEQSIETTMLPKRKQRAALTLGFTSLKDTLEGWSAGGHLANLMFQDSPSMTHPDLYWFLGFNYMRLRGPGAALFGENQLDVAALLGGKEPKATLVAWRLGVELLVKYRLGVNAFVEHIPTLKDSNIISEGDSFPYHNWGISMVIKW